MNSDERVEAVQRLGLWAIAGIGTVLGVLPVGYAVTCSGAPCPEHVWPVALVAGVQVLVLLGAAGSAATGRVWSWLSDSLPATAASLGFGSLVFELLLIASWPAAAMIYGLLAVAWCVALAVMPNGKVRSSATRRGRWRTALWMVFVPIWLLGRGLYWLVWTLASVP